MGLDRPVVIFVVPLKIASESKTVIADFKPIPSPPIQPSAGHLSAAHWAEPAQLHRPLYPARRAAADSAGIPRERPADGFADHGSVCVLYAGWRRSRAGWATASAASLLLLAAQFCGAWPRWGPSGFTSYWTFYVRQALVGVGEATFGIFAPAVLADFYPERDRNRILSVFYLAIPLGAALGYLAGGEMGSMWGWRAPFLVCAIPGLVIAALYMGFGREPVRGSSDHLRATADRPQSGDLSQSGVSDGDVGAGYADVCDGRHFGLGAHVSASDVGLSVANASLTVGAITVVDGIAGTLIGGWLAQMLAAHQLPRALPALVLERGC